MALEGLFEGTQVDAGALLLVPARQRRRPRRPIDAGAPLEIVASRSQTRVPYHRVSPFLAATVLRKGEAVLARNVMGDSTVGSRDSKGEIHATSVICAPIRRGRKVYGPDSSVFDAIPTACPIPTIWSSRWPWPTPWPWRWRISRARQELAENLTQIRDENLQLRERLGVQSEIVGNSPVDAADHATRSPAPRRRTPRC